MCEQFENFFSFLDLPLDFFPKCGYNKPWHSEFESAKIVETYLGGVSL